MFERFFQLQLFDVKILFSERFIFRKLKKTGEENLFSVIKFNRENDDLFQA